MKNKLLNRLPVDLMLTYRCNLKCNKCYAPKEGDEASLVSISKVIDKLYAIGIRRLVLTGGEPLVRQDISDILRFAKERGFEVYVSTNGIRLKEVWSDISPYVSWVSISLDAPTAEIDELVTGELGKYHFNQVIDFLNHYKNLENTAKIKLGTVVTKKNKEHIIELGKNLFERFSGYVPDIWRFYQFSSFEDYNENFSHINSLCITQYEFEEVMKDVMNTFSQINITYATAEERDESYVFIKPDLTIAYSSKGDYIEIGNAQTMSIESLTKVFLKIEHIWGKCITNREMYS
jgi:MoaA/NifB/PqqE/SkfB family radical SAM enzyme